MEQTLGQKRVKAEFNPAKNDLVSQIKDKSAELIDLIETINDITSDEKYVGVNGECRRLKSLAQTEIENASLWAVKACFTN